MGEWGEGRARAVGGWGDGLAFTRYCHYQYGIVHDKQMGGRGGGVYCAIDVQSHCNSAGNADGSGQ